MREELTMADNGTKRKRGGPGRPFQKGQSGNPKGMAKGTRHKATMAVLALLDGEGEALTRKAVEMALAGDTTALRLCLERLCPARKEAPLSISLPDLAGAGDLPKITAAILRAASEGEITPGEAQALAGLVESHRKAVEVADLETRLAALEKAAKEKGNG